MTPDDFARLLAQLTGEIVAQRLGQQPPKGYQVVRQDHDGKQRAEVVTLPQAVVELTDALRHHSEKYREAVSAMNGLSFIMEKNVKVGEKILRRYKDRRDEEDDAE